MVIMTLTLQNLRKDFGGRIAVDIPSLEICDGEFFTFVGPSGCGKSTTLNIIAGLEEPTRGTIRHGNVELTGLPPHRRDIAFVFQSYALYPHRTVARNLSFPLELAGKSGKEIARLVSETAEMLGLTPLLEKLPRQLSGGERQRVALGRAIIRHPKLFLFDEPLSNLDAVLRGQMRRELKRLHERLKTTFIYVTHDQEEALSLSDRVAILREGRIQQCGTPRALYEQPANAFVAAFFGSPPMNFVAGRIEQEGGQCRVAMGSHRQALPGGLALSPRNVSAGIRPEHLRLGRAPTPNSWPMKVGLVEPHGGQVYVELEDAGLRLMAVQGSDATFTPGEPVYVSAAPESILLFDEEGIRIIPARA